MQRKYVLQYVCKLSGIVARTNAAALFLGSGGSDVHATLA